MKVLKLGISLRLLFLLAVPLTLFLSYVHTPHISQLALKDSLQHQFELLNSTLVDVASSDIDELRRAKCVLIGASQPGYRYGKGWIESQLKRSDHVPFVHFTVGNLHNGLAPHYGRVMALISAANILPNAETLVYSDIDTILDFRKVCALYPKRSVVITWKDDIDIQTTWLVVRPHLKNTKRLLREWLRVGRDVKYQDQTVLQELYKGTNNNQTWVEDTVKVIWKKKAWGPGRLQFAHCSSTHSRPARDKCFREWILTNLWPGPYYFDEAAGFRENLGKEFQRLRTAYLSVQFSDISTIRGSECVLIRTSNSSSASLLTSNIPHIDVTHSDSSAVYGRNLPSEYTRLVAIIAASRVLPHVRKFVTTTASRGDDFKSDYFFRSLCRQRPNAAVVLPFPHPMRNNELSIRRRWFVARPRLKDGVGARLLETWLSRGRNGVEVLKELCKRERWVRDLVHYSRK